MLSRKAFLIILNQGLGMVLGGLSLIVIGRYIPKDDFGLIGFAVGLVGMLSFIDDFGFSSAHIKRISEGKDEGECIGTFIAIKVALAVLMTVATAILFVSWQYVLGRGYENPATPFVVGIILLNQIVYSIAQIFIFTFRAKLQIALQAATIATMNVVRFALLVAVAVFSLNVYWLAWSYPASAAFALAVAVVLFIIKRFRVCRPNASLFKSYIKFAIPLAMSTALAVIATNGDKVMIQAFWSASDVADYFMVQKIVLIITGVASAIGSLTMPVVSQAHSKGNMDEIRFVTRDTERYLAMMSLPMIVVFLVFPTQALTIIGGGYVGAAAILRWLALYSFIFILSNVYLYQVSGMDRPGFTAKVALTISVLDIILNLIFIPKEFLGVTLLGLGAVGGALTTAISALVGFIVIRYYSYRLTGMKFNWNLLYHVFAAEVAGGFAFAASLALPPDRIFILLPYCAGVCVVYFGVLAAVGEFTMADVRFFLNAVNPKKMASYIVDEVRGPKSE